MSDDEPWLGSGVYMRRRGGPQVGRVTGAAGGRYSVVLRGRGENAGVLWWQTGGQAASRVADWGWSGVSAEWAWLTQGCGVSV